MIVQLPPRKNRLGLEAAARFAYYRNRCCIFSLFLSPSVRELSNEQSLRATKHSGRKCREHNHLKLLHFHLALRLRRRNVTSAREVFASSDNISCFKENIALIIIFLRK